MRTVKLSARSLFAAALLAGCGAPFTMKTPPSMVELDAQTEYAYRAMTPDGVVLGVRVLEGDGKADVAFWSEAVALHMKELSGYALLGTSEVVTANGFKGKELRFGHDEGKKPYLYTVRLFVGRTHTFGRKDLFLVEAGGTKDEMERAGPTLDWAMGTLKLK